MAPKAKYANRFSIDYPEVPIFSKDVQLTKYPTFKTNWQFSHDKLKELNDTLNQKFQPDKDFSVFVSGSFGRLDANDKSDLDFLIIHDGHIKDTDEKINTVRTVAEDLKISLPNPEGVFAAPRNTNELIVEIGSPNDNLVLTAQRLLLLMEGRPIYNQELFRSAVNKVIDHYLVYVEKEPKKEAVILLNDLIRYFRGICLNVEFSFWKDESTKWGLRNIKLRHSRVLIYAGLLLIILESSKFIDKEKIDFLKRSLHLSPIEKIYSVYKANNDFNFERVVGAYNNFLYKLGKNSARDELKELDFENRYGSHHYTELKTNSDFFLAELTRFILSNKGNWSDRVFEYLIF